jgi:hypothetical protein
LIHLLPPAALPQLLLLGQFWLLQQLSLMQWRQSCLLLLQLGAQLQPLLLEHGRWW